MMLQLWHGRCFVYRISLDLIHCRILNLKATEKKILLKWQTEAVKIRKFLLLFFSSSFLFIAALMSVPVCYKGKTRQPPCFWTKCPPYPQRLVAQKFTSETLYIAVHAAILDTSLTKQYQLFSKHRQTDNFSKALGLSKC